MSNVITNTPIDFQNSLVFDAHLLKTYRACEEKFRLFEEEHLVPKRKSAAPAFGIAMHEGIATFREVRKAGLRFTEAAEAGGRKLLEAYKKHMPLENQQEVMQDDRRSPQNALRLFYGFVEHHESMGYKYLYVEVPFAMLLGTVQIADLDLDGTWSGWITKEVVYTGIIDCVLEHNALVYVNDLKSTAWNITQAWLDGFRLDQGLMGYLVAARELLGVQTNHALVHGIWVQKEAKSGKGKPLSEYFPSKAIFWDQTQIDEWQANTLLTVQRIENSRRTGLWQRDFGQNCGAFGGCGYRQLCWAPPAGRAPIVKMDYERALWSPLEDERLQKLED